MQDENNKYTHTRIDTRKEKEPADEKKHVQTKKKHKKSTPTYEKKIT